MAQYLALPELEGLPVLVDLVDVDSQKWFDYARQARGWKRWMFDLEGRRMRRLEGALPQRAAALMVVSEQEAALYRSFHPTGQIHAIPNGVDLDYFRPDEGGEIPAAESCVFVGALDYRANIDGVLWFCREVWPGVRRRYPRAVFRLVGSNPVAAVHRLARLPGVQLVGNVADVRPYLREAAAVVIPLRVARGIQNKLLEALAVRKATVVTPQALEGGNALPGVPVCQAQTP
ncbi:MAG: glycosyltransferase, partial [Gammaproteobacteria bacterium]|nr:glycosyltransferase [Gammaproteobacteria bacterium]